MKKILLWLPLLLLLTVGVLFLSSCGIDVPEGELRIVAINFVGFDFATTIVGEEADRIAIEYMPAGDGHSFHPTVQDRVRIEESDLFIYVGGESDTAVDALLEGADGVKSFKLTDCVTLHGEEDYEHDHDHDHDHGHEHTYDEHVWTSPENAIAIVKALCEAIVSLDPDNAEIFRQNADAYQKELAALDEDFKSLFSSLEAPTLVFGDRFPFLYFAEHYGIHYHAAFPGCNSSTEPSFYTVIELVELVKAEGYTTVFHIESGSHAVAERIAEEAGVTTALLHSCQQVTKEEIAAGASYLSFMRQNLKTLRAALT